MDHSRAIRFLYDLQSFGARPGLESTRRLAELAGHPERRLRFIHLAGTNGKGSVAALLAGIYQAAGLQVGLFTSPHLIRFNERIQVNCQPVADDAFCRLVEEFQELLKRGADHGWWPDSRSPATASRPHPTFFEVTTMIAARHFANERCDLIIWETGLGGRLDATNIVTPVASVITNVSVEHGAWLGDRVEKIAAEKSGIIKPGVPVFTGATDPAVLRVLREVAASRRAPFQVADEETVTGVPADNRLIKAPFLRRNTALALTVARGLQSVLPVSPAALARGLNAFHWPGRLHEVQFEGGTLIIDGAHNPAGAAALAEALRALYPDRRFQFVGGMLRDKNQAEYFRALAPILAGCSLVPVDGTRGMPVRALAEIVQEAVPGTPVRIFDNLNEALQNVPSPLPALITGSLYLVGEALRLLDAGATTSEAALNDWPGEPKDSN